jgi:prepilin-type processing-associated H-X9-DG protein
MPFIEQHGLYAVILEKTNEFEYGLKNSLFWQTLSPEQQKSFQSVHYYRCPSRRGGAVTTLVEMTAPDTFVDADQNLGTQGDYAIVVGRRTAHWSGWIQDNQVIQLSTLWAGLPDKCGPDLATGPFRTAVWSYNTPKSWNPRDTFARLIDGTSNQIIVGEKFIPRDNIGKCESTPRSETGDCSILGYYVWAGFAGARSFNAFICNDLNLPGTTNSYDESMVQWGGCHNTICNFLFADGSVKGISVTTPTGELGSGATPGNSILARLGNVDDGNTVILP